MHSRKTSVTSPELHLKHHGGPWCLLAFPALLVALRVNTFAKVMRQQTDYILCFAIEVSELSLKININAPTLYYRECLVLRCVVKDSLQTSSYIFVSDCPGCRGHPGALCSWDEGMALPSHIRWRGPYEADGLFLVGQLFVLLKELNFRICWTLAACVVRECQPQVYIVCIASKAVSTVAWTHRKAFCFCLYPCMCKWYFCSKVWHALFADQTKWQVKRLLSYIYIFCFLSFPFRYFVVYFSVCNTSVYIVVNMAVDRFIYVYFPYSAKTVCTHR